MALITLPMMSSVQFMCAKIGMVTGRGLAGVLKTHYSRPLVYASVFSLVIANSINAGADIGAIAAGINLLASIPVWSLIVPIAMSAIALQIWDAAGGCCPRTKPPRREPDLKVGKNTATIGGSILRLLR